MKRTYYLEPLPTAADALSPATTMGSDDPLAFITCTDELHTLIYIMARYAEATADRCEAAATPPDRRRRVRQLVAQLRDATRRLSELDRLLAAVHSAPHARTARSDED